MPDYGLDEMLRHAVIYDRWVEGRGLWEDDHTYNRRQQEKIEEKERFLDRCREQGWRPDTYWDWRAVDESWCEEGVLDAHKIRGENWGWLVFIFLLVTALAWAVLMIVLNCVFAHRETFDWEVPMDMGIVVLITLCTTFLGAVALVCYTTYRLRMAQIKERKEIRQTEYDTKLLEHMSKNGGTLSVREVR